MSDDGNMPRARPQDGKRIAVVAPVSTPDAPKAEHEVVFLQDFFDELRRKVPAGK